MKHPGEVRTAHNFRCNHCRNFVATTPQGIMGHLVNLHKIPIKTINRPKDWGITNARARDSTPSPVACR